MLLRITLLVAFSLAGCAGNSTARYEDSPESAANALPARWERRVLHYDRDPRAAGRTKWGYPALARLAWEGITSFSTKPLKLATLLGLSAAVCGAAYGAWIVFKALVLGDPVAGYPSLIAIITLLGGAQLCTIGIVGEYVGKIYIEAKQRPIYLIYDDSKDTAANRSQEDLDEPARVGIR